VRLLILSLHAGLTLGSVTMLYPFGLMIAGSTKSNVDTPDAELIPRYLIDRDALWRKYAEGLFNESFELARVTFPTDVLTFRDLKQPSSPNRRWAELWEEFCGAVSMPPQAYMIGHVYAPRTRGVLPANLRDFKYLLSDMSGGDLERLNHEMGSEFVGWNSVFYNPPEILGRRARPGILRLDEVYRDFAAGRPLHDRVFFSLEGYYKRVFLQARYGRDIHDFNAAVGASYRSWRDVQLPRGLVETGTLTERERQDWEEFVRKIANLYWIRVDQTATPAYQAYLRAKHASLDLLNKRYGTSYASWRDIALVDQPPMQGMVLSDWASWLDGWTEPESGERFDAPLEAIRIHSVDFMFRDWLREKFGSVEALGHAVGDRFTSWMEVTLPQEDFHYLNFAKRIPALRSEYSARNFISVIDYIVLHGRGILNTVIYCVLAILSALLVNPLAAYALSRYKPPSQYKILLFLMLTMSFPPMVTQIPVFLMLRELNLLNTFAALVLPGLANGYSIFLLKGFFDSLPQELYESAQIDGAGELRVFWQITMSLSKPILAVIALNAFNMAYSNFMMALLICQDERMWTLMPWLYQLQTRSGEGVVFASLLIAAIPTLIVFVFCQNVIMRGIVVPVEK
jgi:multiple sugar transport system permease protein